MLKSERTQLEKDLNQVQQLDRALLPNLPVVNGWDVGLHYRPSRLLSGDFYDVREEGDGRLTIVVGDVMGKGIPAALLRTGLQGSLKALAPELRGNTDAEHQEAPNPRPRSTPTRQVPLCLLLPV